MYLGPYNAGRFEQMWCRPIGSNWANLNFKEHFPVQNQNSKGIFYEKLGVINIAGGMKFAKQISPLLIFLSLLFFKVYRVTC